MASFWWPTADNRCLPGEIQVDTHACSCNNVLMQQWCLGKHQITNYCACLREFVCSEILFLWMIVSRDKSVLWAVVYFCDAVISMQTYAFNNGISCLVGGYGCAFPIEVRIWGWFSSVLRIVRCRCRWPVVLGCWVLCLGVWVCVFFVIDDT